MSDRPVRIEDWINGTFKPVIGFFLGIALGYLAQLAAVAGVGLALSYGALVSLIFLLVVAASAGLDRVLDTILGKIGWGNGIKPARNPAPEPKLHWFVRYGWVLGMMLGLLAAFVLPKEMLSWL